MHEARRVACAAALVAAMACGERSAPPSHSELRRPEQPGPRLTMDTLHQLGGVPAGWQLSPPPGDVARGRKAFEDLGCDSCHLVAGEKFAKKPGAGGVGPELTGMGSHHPTAYFAEAILNPDAVLVDGPGWIGEDGHSVMPVYPDMTLAQLADVVAYLGSLRTGGAHEGHQMANPQMANQQTGKLPGLPPGIPPSLVAKPTPPETPARSFFVQSYEVLPGKLAEFESWFRTQGAQRFLAYDGLLSVETYVDTTKAGPTVTSVFGFRDDAALNRFMGDHDPAAVSLGLEFDRFVGDHDHKVFRRQPVYKAPNLSAP